MPLIENSGIWRVLSEWKLGIRKNEVIGFRVKLDNGGRNGSGHKGLIWILKSRPKKNFANLRGHLRQVSTTYSP